MPLSQFGRCYACDKSLGRNPALADTRDNQIVFVGTECSKQIQRAGNAGWQPPKGGPRLYPIRSNATGDEIDAMRRGALLK